MMLVESRNALIDLITLLYRQFKKKKEVIQLTVNVGS